MKMSDGTKSWTKSRCSATGNCLDVLVDVTRAKGTFPAKRDFGTEDNLYIVKRNVFYRT